MTQRWIMTLDDEYLTKYQVAVLKVGSIWNRNSGDSLSQQEGALWLNKTSELTAGLAGLLHGTSHLLYSRRACHGWIHRHQIF